MFKGQGCNQALSDGPLLASWLLKPGLSIQNISTRLRCFEREMISRTSSKVQASRKAAHLYHCQDSIYMDYGFEGIEQYELAEFRYQLRNQNITANLGDNLDEACLDIIRRIRFHNSDN
jgi:hypothetical protein